MGIALAEAVIADLGIVDAGELAVSGITLPPGLSSPLAVAEVAVSSVAASLIAAADLSLARSGRRPEVTLDTGHVAAVMRSEVYLRDPTGRSLSGFAPLSRLWPSGDGWVRTHANYPWHRAALLRALEIVDTAGDDVEVLVGNVIAQSSARELEDTVYDAGGMAVAARSEAEWRQSDAGIAVAASSLVTTVSLPTTARAVPLPVGSPGELPASGVKVLDLTRVIAGPVGTRMLAALGADVLRVDHPARPELALHAIDGVIGKASTTLDAITQSGYDVLHGLVDEADVVVTGYRPGSLRRLGLDADQVAERHPGTIVVSLSAWGTSGPWGIRRGFDSLVQIASGIGQATSSDGNRPGSLPCQLLDHATGYLLAAGALAALANRARTGLASHVSVSLARTAQWLLDQGVRTEEQQNTAEQAEMLAAAYRVSLGDGWSSISPPGQIDGQALRWPHLPPRYGCARPSWA